MKKMNRIAALVLALIMCLGMMGTAAASERQIVEQGREVSVENGAVKLSKTIAGTDTENVFDITLKVTTSENLEEIATSPNTAVVLVIDSSSSMIHNNYGDNTRLYAAKNSARSFVDSYVNDYQKQVQSDPDLVRKLAVVNFDSTSYTTYKMEQLKADSAAATATAVKAAIGDPSKDVPNTDSYGPYYGTFDGISVHGGTNIEAGLTTAKDLLDKSGVPQQNQYIILLSDGQPSRWIGSTSTNPKNHSSHSRVTNEQGTAIGDVLYDSVNVYSVYIAGANDTIDDCFTPECAYEGETVTTWLGHFSHIVSTPGKPDELTKFFERISKLITVYANAWTVNDPMGEYIEFDSVTANADHTSFKDNNLKWNLRLDEPVVDTTVTPNTYTYEMTYRVKLDNLAEGFVAGVANPTNGETVLYYFMSENRDDPDPKLEQAEFDVPAVKGLVGSLEFNKVDDQYNPLSGAKFTLTINEDGETWSTTATSTNGKVSFTNIPSGHKYTLKETSAPDGYVADAKTHNVNVSFGETYIDEKAITEAPLTVVNDRKVAQVTVTKSFVNLPEELWPKITITLTNTEDKTKSYFATLPEDDETPWVADIEVAAPGTYTVSESAANVPGWTLTLPETSSVTVDIGETKAVAIKNVYTQDVGDLTITKAFGEGSDITVDNWPKDKTLSFSISGTDKTVTLPENDDTPWSAVVKGLPVGDYTVTESNTNVVGHTVVTTYTPSSTARIIKDGEATIEVNNEYTKVIGDLVVTKDVTGDLTEDDLAGKAITFNVTGPDGYKGPASFTLPESDDTPWAWSVSNVPLGNYTVTESGAGVENYTLTTTYKVNGEAADAASVELTKKGAAIEIINTYEQDLGDLIITKTFSGDPVDVPEGLSFTVTGPHDYSATIAYADFNNRPSHKIEGLPVGDYTVSESNTNVVGHTVVTTYKVNGEETSTAAVIRNGSANIEVDNDYTKIIGDLIVTKDVAGDLTEEDFDGKSITFTVSGPEGYNGPASFTLPESDDTPWAWSVSNVPLGNYTVTESGAGVENYTLTTTYKVNGEAADAASVKLTKKGAAIEIINTYEQDLGDLIITKTFSGDPVDVPEGLSFTVTGPHDYSATIAYADFNNDSSYTIEDLPVGEYTVVEKNTAIEGYTVTTTYNGKTAESAAVELTKDGAGVEIVNIYTLGEAASLEIPVRKIVERGEGGNTDPAGERVFQFKMTIADYISPRGKVNPGEYEVTFGDQKLTPVHGVYTFELTVSGCGSEQDMLVINANPADLVGKQIVITELSATESGYLPDSSWTYDQTEYNYQIYYYEDGVFGIELWRTTEDEKWDSETVEFKNLYTFVTEEPPKTGDNSQLGLWMALMVLSAAGFVFTMKRRSAQN